jgi:hypothetical protein
MEKVYDHRPTATPPGKLQRLKAWMIRLDIFNRLKIAGTQALTLLSRNVPVFVWLLLLIAALTAICLYSHNITLISLSGLFWLAIGLTVFSVVVFFDKGLKKVAAFVKKLLIQHTAQAPDAWQHTDASAIVVFLKLAYYAATRLVFTIAGAIISLTHLMISWHIRSALPVDDPFLTKELAAWMSWLFVVGAPVIGVITDMTAPKERQVTYRGGLVMGLGFIQFYGSFMVLFTGLLGGVKAMAALHTLLHKPHFLLPYGHTFSYAIFEGVGMFWFIVIYLVYPFTFAYLTHIHLTDSSLSKSNTSSKSDFKDLPKASLQILRAVSLLFLAIGLIITWNESWVSKTFWLLLGWIGEGLKLVVGLF